MKWQLSIGAAGIVALASAASYFWPDTSQVSSPVAGSAVTPKSSHSASHLPEISRTAPASVTRSIEATGSESREPRSDRSLIGASEDLPSQKSVEPEVIQIKLPAQPVSLPLALEEFDRSVLNLEPGQLLALEQVQELFIELLGQDQLDAKDPVYARRWQIAQAHVDEILEARLGTVDFLRIEDYLAERRSLNGSH